MTETETKTNLSSSYIPRDKKEINIAIGNRLQELRMENAISKKEIATLLDLTVPQYHRYEGGTNMFPYEMLAKIQETYHFDLNYIFTGKRTEPRNLLAQIANMTWHEKCESFAQLMQYWGEFMRRANWSKLMEKENT